MTKRAQTAIFTILALLVVLVGVLILFYQEPRTPNIEQALVESQIAVPTEFQPVQQFMQSCIEVTGKEALRRIGQNGGYLSISPDEYSTKAFTITPDTTESDALRITPNSNQAIPYWHYLSAPNSCTGSCELSSQRPPLTGPGSIEEQLILYVGNNLPSCINDFQTLREQGFTFDIEDEFDVQAQINDQDLLIVIQYPLSMQRQNTQFDIDAFSHTFDVNLAEMYNIATHVTNLQADQRFFERFALNMIAAFSSPSPDRLPPMSGLEFELGSTVFWSKQDVKRQIKTLLSGYTQLFQVEGTANFNRNEFDSALKQRMYDQLIIPNQEQLDNVDVTFTYLEPWDLYLDLNCDGDFCQPSSGTSLIGVFGFQQYNFVYDLSFPVMVEVTNPDALGGEGFTFRYALEANIRNNDIMPTDFAPLEKVDAYSDSSLCDPQSATSPDTQIIVQSKGSAVPESNIFLSIIDEHCYLGKTDEQGILTTKLPQGIAGGALHAQSQNYLETSVPYQINNRAVNIDLVPIVEKQIDIQKFPIHKASPTWQLSSTPAPLAFNEEAVVVLTAADGTSFSSIAQVKGGQVQPTLMRLAPGEYDADITLILKEKITIPSEEKCEGFAFIEECVTIPEMTFGTDPEPQYLAGGYSGKITITDSVLSSDIVTFYVLAPDTPQVFDDLEPSQDIDTYSQSYQNAVQPTGR